MSKTPLLSLLRRAVRTASRQGHDSSRDRLVASRDRLVASPSSEGSISRRDILKTGALAGAGLLVPSWITGCGRPSDVPESRKAKVVVVGAGVAGLHAAWLLKKQGINAEVYEAASRTGGRMMTARNIIAPGTWTELGGEFIDSAHTDMLRLVKEFNLELLDFRTDAFTQYNDVYWFEGRRYTEADVVREIGPLLEAIDRDLRIMPASYESLRESPAQAFDTMSLDAYFTSLGINGWLRSFLEVAFVTENGLELGEQSALNFLSVVSSDISDGMFHQYGTSDERYKIRGGNEQICGHLTAGIFNHIHMSHQLEQVAKRGSRYVLTFRKDSSSVETEADIVLLALPWTILRNVDLPLDLPPLRRKMINELRYGQNGKTIIGFDRPFWHDSIDNGFAYSDLRMQVAWDNTALQGKTAGGLTFFSGGSMNRVIGGMTKDETVRMILNEVKNVWPLAASAPIRKTERMQWPQQPFIKASYSSYGPGQWTDFYGRESKPEGHLFFAGEHCSNDHRGYMNGAAETGRFAAEKIAALLVRA